MKNLKENRLGYEFTNALGHKCKVTAYKNNKEVVVHDEVTDKFHECRWCDLHNPRCKAVYDATQKKAVETPTINRKDYDEELVNRVRESENWCFPDEISALYQEEVEDYAEPRNGCVLVWAIIAVVAVVATALYLVWR